MRCPPGEPCLRVAAVGDVHVGMHDDPPAFEGIERNADLLLLAGDLTRRGRASEARRLASALEPLAVPVIAVLGNHDHHNDTPHDVAAELTSAGVTVLDGSSTVIDVHGCSVGVAGTKGFGGGMPGERATEFGEPEMKEFVRVGAREAQRLRSALMDLDTDIRLVLLHYSPVVDTLQGEPVGIHAFLGDFRLAEVVDETGADLVVHGHAHLGREHGRTAGGVPVRNVALPVIRECYRVYELPLHARVSSGA